MRVLLVYSIDWRFFLLSSVIRFAVAHQAPVHRSCCYTVLHHPVNGLATRCRYLIVDEFQDCNLLQFELAADLASVHRALMVVGDPDQCIYGWRQADVHIYQRFNLLQCFPECQQLGLSWNYRCRGSCRLFLVRPECFDDAFHIAFIIILTLVSTDHES